ncbi:aminotransferase class I/II-fold pyridoxal phosphate-dependent enzyme [Phycisphaerales bacterium AB-hyl4]|uniref:Aminotransferase class I/II-fold pyridoxal phosphate-dependent enzyme n=1 Tax=Natronomicrosphaera hydrolytica TaxID=3242702 RepID=A0ABV4UBF1_9BACT
MLEQLLSELRDDLDQLDARSLRRRLTPRPAVGRIVHLDGKPLINLAANDYLALSQHPHLKQAAIDAINRYGTGATASRLVTGHLTPHQSLEQRFSAFKHPTAPPGFSISNQQSAISNYNSLLFPTGYTANLAVLSTLAGQGDLIAIDKLTHASLIDAARATPADVRTYPHLHHEKLTRLLARHQQTPTPKSEIRNPKSEIPNSHPRPPRRFIVTDSVFSMDGDTADLPALCDLADRYDAILIVDEAHGTGVLGQTGTGLAEAQHVAHRIPIIISTASKALGSLGGIVTAPAPIIDTLINRARAFIYTTGVPPAQADTIAAALDVIRDEPERRHRLADLSARLRTALQGQGWPLPTTDYPTPIIPLQVGTAERALALASHLQQAGYLAVAIRPPTVAPNTARVRLSLRADLTDTDIENLITALAR